MKQTEKYIWEHLIALITVDEDVNIRMKEKALWYAHF